MLSRFGKGGGSSPRKSAAAGPLSLIGTDVRIVGNIATEGEIQIDGQLDGDIACHRLLIGESGRVAGEVTAETIQIHGEVVGKITAGAVVIARAGRVSGDIIHDSIEIEAGAQLEGRLIRKAATEAAPALAAAAAPARLAPPRPDKTKEKDKAAEGDLSAAVGTP